MLIEMMLIIAGFSSLFFYIFENLDLFKWFRKKVRDCDFCILGWLNIIAALVVSSTFSSINLFFIIICPSWALSIVFATFIKPFYEKRR